MPTIAFIVFKTKGNRYSRFATLEKHFSGKGLRKEFSVRNYLGESVTNSFQFKFKMKVRDEFKVKDHSFRTKEWSYNLYYYWYVFSMI